MNFNLEPVRSLWVGPEVPPAQRACIESFLRVGHPFELFVYDEVRGVPAGTRIRQAGDIVPSSRVFRYGEVAGTGAGGLSGFSNLFRYALLVKEGGYWVDTDEFCLKPFPTDAVVIGSERRRDGVVLPNSGVLKCPARHSFAYFCFDLADNADPTTLPHGATGPSLVGKAVEKLRMSSSVVAPEVFCDIDWHDHEALLRPGRPSEAACGVHLWGEMWRRQAGGIPWPGPKGSLMHGLSERLQVGSSGT